MRDDVEDGEVDVVAEPIKHITLKFHYIKYVVEDGEVDVVYCNTEDQVADIFTKALLKDRFVYLQGLLGVKKHEVKQEAKN